MKEKIEVIVRELLKGTHLWLEEVIENKLHIEIISDGWCGINLNECAMISRSVHAILEEQKVDTGAYVIDVLSPGTEKPIITTKDFVLNMSRRIQIRNKQNKFVKGYIVLADNQNIMLKTGGGFKTKFETFKIEEIKEAITII